MRNKYNHTRVRPHKGLFRRKKNVFRLRGPQIVAAASVLVLIAWIYVSSQPGPKLVDTRVFSGLKNSALKVNGIIKLNHLAGPVAWPFQPSETNGSQQSNGTSQFITTQQPNNKFAQDGTGDTIEGMSDVGGQTAQLPQITHAIGQENGEEAIGVKSDIRGGQVTGQSVQNELDTGEKWRKKENKVQYTQADMQRLLEASRDELNMDNRRNVPSNNIQQQELAVEDDWDGIYDASCYYKNGLLKSKYCSVGQIIAIKDSMDDMSSVQRAVKRRSFRRELIVMVGDAQHLDMSVNTIYGLHDWGLMHYMFLMPHEYDCNKLMTTVPTAGCLWSSLFTNISTNTHTTQAQTHATQTLYHPVRRIWMLRWLLFTRLLQLRTNVLMIDTDNVMLHDFYHFAKHPTFRRFHLSLPTEPTEPGINAGAVYAQNVAPRGPVSWIASTVATRTLQYLRDPTWLFDTFPGWRGDMSHLDVGALYEQNLLNDGACSAVVGRETFYHSLGPHPTFSPGQHKEWREYHHQLCGQWREWVTHVPDEWEHVVHGRHSVLTWQALYLPRRLRGGWGPEVNHVLNGRDPFPPKERLREEGVLMDWLNEGGGVWDSSVSGSTAGDDVVEYLLKSTPWYMGRFGELGITGWWDPSLTPTPGTVLGHVIMPAFKVIDQRAKIGTYKVYGWWHWQTTIALHGKHPFTTLRQPRPYPKLLALAPWVNMVTGNLPTHYFLVSHLLRAAALTKRMLVWPRAHCHSPWIHSIYPWDNVTAAHPIKAPMMRVWGPLNDLKCLPMYTMNQGCEEIGVHPYDYHYILSKIPPNAGIPTPQNTLNFPNQQSAQPAAFDASTHTDHRAWVAGNQYPQQEKPHVLDADWLKNKLMGLTDAPVIFLGATVVVRNVPESEHGRMDEQRELCNLPLLFNGHKDAWWK